MKKKAKIFGRLEENAYLCSVNNDYPVNLLLGKEKFREGYVLVGTASEQDITITTPLQ